MECFFSTGTMAVCLKHEGTTDRERERLNMEVKTSASWSAHPMRTRPEMLSGPGDTALLTSAVVRESAVILVLSMPFRRNCVRCLKPCLGVELALDGGGRLGIIAVSTFIFSDLLQSTPYASLVKAVVVRLQLILFVSFGISDGLP